MCELPPCESSECWYESNPDRIFEYCPDYSFTFVINNITGDALYKEGFENEQGEKANSYGCFKRTLCSACSEDMHNEGVCDICGNVMYNRWIDFGKNYCQICIPDIELTDEEMNNLTIEIRDKCTGGSCLWLIQEMIGNGMFWFTDERIKSKSDRVILREALRREIGKGRESFEASCEDERCKKERIVKRLSLHLDWSEDEARKILEYINYDDIPERGWTSRADFVLWAFDKKVFRDQF